MPGNRLNVCFTYRYKSLKILKEKNTIPLVIQIYIIYSYYVGCVSANLTATKCFLTGTKFRRCQIGTNTTETYEFILLIALNSSLKPVSFVFRICEKSFILIRIIFCEQFKKMCRLFCKPLQFPTFFIQKYINTSINIRSEI